MFSELLINESYSVIGLSETWLDHSALSNAFHVSGYKLERKYRGSRGGIAFYIKNSVKYKIIDVTTPANSCLEQLWISTSIAGRSVGSLCRSPQNNVQVCLHYLENLFSSFMSVYEIVLFGGDFNRDMNNKNPLQKWLKNYGLHQLITNLTRISKTSITLIDLMSSDIDLVESTHVVKMEEISDN
ncbi:hypothetical protein JTB14_031990 [Gonioctena quinquepunctata]|nr:hypothetical protein JTB14_031990 [Gonioctena quinquepunctata]